LLKEKHEKVHAIKVFNDHKAEIELEGDME